MATRPQRLPQQIDPFRLAETGRSLAGPLPLAGLDRLAPLLAADGGEVEVELSFARAPQGGHVAEGTVRGRLRLVCQRCLQPVTVEVDIPVRLAFVHHEAEMAGLGPEYEPCLVGEDALRLADMVEDELLLALPQVPMHPPEACPAARVAAPETEPEPEREHPFAALAQLKKTDTD